MKYFAYGSNMSIRRIQQRVPEAQMISTAILKEHILLFHKVSKDGSGKCDAFFTGNQQDFLIGVLYNIEKKDKKELDKAEGLGQGYDEKEVVVYIDNDIQNVALTYVATEYDNTLKPFSWYKKHVLKGAKEANLPFEYIKTIEAVESVKDEDDEREKKELNIYG